MHRILLTLPVLFLLSACQTTGTNYAAIPNGITPADSNMTCDQMQAEFMQLDQIITAAGGAQANNQMANAGVQAAQQSMYYSTGYQERGILSGLATFANSMTSSNAQQTQQQAYAAQNRRNQLLTLAQQKGCM